MICWLFLVWVLQDCLNWYISWTFYMNSCNSELLFEPLKSARSYCSFLFFVDFWTTIFKFLTSHEVVAGLHVALIMFTGYLVGYALFRALFRHDPIMVFAGYLFNLRAILLISDISNTVIYSAINFFFLSFSQSAAGGILGLVFGMLVETLLFIIRSSNYDNRSSPSKLKKSQ